MTGRWASSRRRTQLPPDWSARRTERRRIARDRCEAEQHAPTCDGRGAELDHHEHRDNHDVSALRWLSGPCHQAKTQREAAAARPSRLRPVAAHPSERAVAFQARPSAGPGAWGGDPLPEGWGTGGDSSSARIQVPGLSPSRPSAPAAGVAPGAGELEPAAAGGGGQAGAGCNADGTSSCPRCGWGSGHALWCPTGGVR